MVRPIKMPRRSNPSFVSRSSQSSPFHFLLPFLLFFLPQSDQLNERRKRKSGGRSGRSAWRLIERATKSTEPEVDPRLLKVVKSAMRSSEVKTHVAVRCLMDLMKKPHSQKNQGVNSAMLQI